MILGVHGRGMFGLDEHSVGDDPDSDQHGGRCKGISRQDPVCRTWR